MIYGAYRALEREILIIINAITLGFLLNFTLCHWFLNLVSGPVTSALPVNFLETQNWEVALVVKNLPPNPEDVRDVSSIPGSGRSPGGGHGNPLLYAFLENPMDRGVWQAIVYESRRVGLKQLNVHEPRSTTKNSGSRAKKSVYQAFQVI